MAFRHLALILLLSCSRTPTSAPSGPTAPRVEKPRSPLEVVPAGDAVLSLLEPVKERCEWRRVSGAPSGASAVVASFPGTCTGATVAFSADAARAVVWFDPRLVHTAGIGGPELPAPGHPDEAIDELARPRAYAVTVASGEVRPLPVPGFPVEALGIAADGGIIALSVEDLDEAAVEKGSVTVDGKDIALEPVSEGIPALAHAWTLTGDRWVRSETAQTTTGWDYAMGVQATGAYKALGPRSSELLSTTPPREAAEPSGPILEALAPLAPPDAEGAWQALGREGLRAFVWTISGELVHTTGLVALERPTLTVASQLGFTAGELVSLQTRGPYVLVASGGAGAYPRMYSVATGSLTFRSDTARATTFWP